jgi:protein gp37
MGQKTDIAWTDATFNPWWGCSKVSPACDHCYAESWAKRTGFDKLWSGEYRFFSKRHWDEPLKWNRKAAEAGVRKKVFCASMADVFDNAPQLEEHRQRLWHLISSTPNLDWLLLTKRIGNAAKMMPDHVSKVVWLGATVVTQEEYNRDIWKLLNTPARIRFLSMEPLLQPIRLFPPPALQPDWIIVGGESGSKARHMDMNWALDIRRQCERAGVAYFMKQLSENGNPFYKDVRMFPRELQLREFPNAPTAV